MCMKKRLLDREHNEFKFEIRLLCSKNKKRLKKKELEEVEQHINK